VVVVVVVVVQNKERAINSLMAFGKRPYVKPRGVSHGRTLNLLYTDRPTQAAFLLTTIIALHLSV
jgi:hypothetical protein